MHAVVLAGSPLARAQRSVRGAVGRVLVTLVTVQVLVSSVHLWLVATDEKARNDRGSDATEKAIMIIAAIAIAGIVGTAVQAYVKKQVGDFKDPSFKG